MFARLIVFSVSDFVSDESEREVGIGIDDDDDDDRLGDVCAIEAILERRRRHDVRLFFD
jgi:hypothetical protein